MESKNSLEYYFYRGLGTVPAFIFLLGLMYGFLEDSDTGVLLICALGGIAVLYFIVGGIMAYSKKKMKLVGDIFGTRRDSVYVIYICICGLMAHYLLGRTDAATWWLLLVCDALYLIAGLRKKA